MNWEAIGAIGEIFGAAAVVISLVYLATQIRVSNKAARQGAMQELQNLNSQALSQISSNTENARIWAMGGMNDADLSDYEKVQYRVFLYQINTLWERMYRANLAGEVDSWFWESNLQTIRRIVASEGFKMWFNELKHTLSTDWVEFIESEINSSTYVYYPQGVKLEKKNSS